MKKRFEGEVAVITGGSGGIGRAAAEAFAARGAKVVVVGRSEAKLAEAVEAIERAGGVGEALVGDVASEADMEAIARRVAEQDGKVDVLINGAGVLHLGPVEALDAAVFRETIEVNFLGVVHAVKAFLPLLRAGNRKVIINLSSLAGRIAPPYFSSYAGSKFAVAGFSHALRQEVSREGIRVVVVYPGPIQTPMIEGKIRGEYYPLPPGVPIVGPEAVARALVRAALRPRRELAVPKRLKAPTWLGSLFPAIVDWMYRPLDYRSRT